MSIIGIIAKTKQIDQLKREKEDIKQEIVCINPKCIENVKNIKFEIIVIHDFPEILKEKKEYLREIIKNAKYILLNTDIKIENEILESIDINIITYGLNQKATITASSIEEKKIIISIQRAFKDMQGRLVEVQEIPKEVVKNNINSIYNSLIKIAIINICTSENRPK